MAESINDALEFRTKQKSSEKENYDRLLAVFHTGTHIKRCLLEQYLNEKKLDLFDWLTDLNQTSILTSEDVKRAIKRSSTIHLIDLEPTTLDILLKYNCFDMFWKLCLLNTRLEDILNSHKQEMYRIYQNSVSYNHPSSSTEQYAPSLTPVQWQLLFETDNLCDIKNCDMAARTGITLSGLDNNLNFLILHIVCPLFKSVITVSNCQNQISKIAAFKSISEKHEFDDIWDKMEANIVKLGSHCKLPYFHTKCKEIKQTLFNRTLSQENRKCILEDLFNKPDFIRDKLFCNRVRKELDLIIIQENLNLARKLCGAEIPILLVDKKYTTGAYPLSVLENADKDLQICKSVCNDQIIEEDIKEKEMNINDKQEKINRHNHLKIVNLLMHIGKDVLVDVLKLRLRCANYGYAFKGMKNRLVPLLNNCERQLLYPDMSFYKGDLTDLDISIIYKILRNINTICPHLNGWGKIPNDDDTSLSANIDRIRIFKNKFVSHCTKCSLTEEEFIKTWKEIRQCIIDLGGASYISEIDSLFTSEINPVMESELVTAFNHLKETERLNTVKFIKKEEELNHTKNQILKSNTQRPHNVSTPSVLLENVHVELRMTGENIPSVMKMKESTDIWTSEDMSIEFVKKGSIIIGLEVSPSALTNVGHFLKIIDSLLSSVLQCHSKDGDGYNAHVYVSIDFMDSNNEPIQFPMKRTDVSSFGSLSELVLKPQMKNRIMFVKCFIMIVDHCKSWLVDFAENRVKASSNHTTLEQFINSTDPMIKLSFKTMKTPADFDISDLQSIISFGNLLQSGEMKTALHAGKTIGDYIDRICEIYNNFLHTTSAILVEQDYNDYFAEFHDIATRFEKENTVSKGCYVKEIDKINEEPLDNEAVEKAVKRYHEYIKDFFEPDFLTNRLETPPLAHPAPNDNNEMNCLTMQFANRVARMTDNPIVHVVGGIAGGAFNLAADIATAPFVLMFGKKK